jgi:hypothetical protein
MPLGAVLEAVVPVLALRRFIPGLGQAMVILNNVDIKSRLSGHWQAVRQDLMQARFGARRAEVHGAMRHALFVEGWLAG